MKSRPTMQESFKKLFGDKCFEFELKEGQTPDEAVREHMKLPTISVDKRTEK